MLSTREACVAFFLLVNAAILATIMAISTRVAVKAWGLNPYLAYLPFFVVFGTLSLIFIVSKKIMR